jgi:benzoate membrane transport protein
MRIDFGQDGRDCGKERLMARASIWRDFNMASFWAGITAYVWYAFGALPLHLEVAGQLGIDRATASSWIFIIWLTAAVLSVGLTLWYRIPLAITWSIPGLIFLGALAGQFTFPQLVGANLMAAVAILVLGVAGIGRRIMDWLPLPIIMGMFSGSILVYVTRMVQASVNDVLVAGITLGAYLVGRLIDSARLPPVGLAVVVGGIAVYFFGQAEMAAVAIELPEPVFPGMEFSLGAFLGISLPMVIFAMGLGNVQGLGFLMAQDYKVPTTAVTVSIGLGSIVNAFFGGHTASVARSTAGIVASSDAGPHEKRYWANLVASVAALSIAVSAASVASLLTALPRSFVVTLAGLAILAAMQDGLQRAFSGTCRFGALAAFAVAATPFKIIGIPSAFWAVVLGVLASLMAERKELFDHWRRKH